MLPDMSLADIRRSSSLLAPPRIPIVNTTGAQLVPIPQSPASMVPAVGMPTPKPRREANEALIPPKIASSKESDYFSMKTKQTSSMSTTPDDFSGWGGPRDKDKDGAIPQTPSTPSGGGFIGRLRHFGKSSKRPISGEITGTSGGSLTSRTSESQDENLKAGHSCRCYITASSLYIIQEGKIDEPLETEQSRFLGSLISQSFFPPSATDAPSLSLPPDTEIVLAEETQSGWSNIYRGTVANVGQDTALLEKIMPLWLMQYLLANKVPLVPNIKVSFGVAPWSDTPAAAPATGEASPEALNAYAIPVHLFFADPLNLDLRSPSRLTANRYLRVRKILAYVCHVLFSLFSIFSCYVAYSVSQVQDKIDKPSSQSVSSSGSISGATPRSSTEAPRTARSGSVSSQSHVSHKHELDGSKKPRPEDIYELLCNDVILPLNMTLASIRHYVWRSSAELLLFYRRKA